MTRQSFDRSIAVAFLGFIVLGLPDGLLGLAWPSIQAQFNLPAAALGSFFVAGTIGFVTVSLFSGALSRRFGIRHLLIGAYSLRGTAMVLVFFAPSWEIIVLLGFIAGLGDGGIDTGLNLYVAGYDNPRLMNYLHAFFGLGAAFGPLLMVGLFSIGLSWTFGFLIVGMVKALMVVLLLFVRLHDVSITQPHGGEPAASLVGSMRVPMVWMGVFAFFIATGLEMNAGQWSYTLFTQGRGTDPTTAGIWISLYRAMFTVGRFFFGFIGDRGSIVLQMRGSLTLAVLASILVWSNISQTISAVGLILMGLAIAPQFPLLMAGTVRRVGLRHAANAIGLQMGGASLGVGVFPGLTGWLVQLNENAVMPLLKAPFPFDQPALRFNPALETVALVFVVMSVALFIVYELMTLAIRRN
ncbi:MAG: MFS transporter [Anaerolineaceae bacterium]|nr:MAG: MFS transporter [Anaerolineaceae bacterium]